MSIYKKETLKILGADFMLLKKTKFCLKRVDIILIIKTGFLNSLIEKGKIRKMKVKKSFGKIVTFSNSLTNETKEF